MYKFAALLEKSSIFVQIKFCMKKVLSDIFAKNGGYLSRSEIDSRAVYYHLLDMVKSGTVDRVKAGVYYYNPDDDGLMIDINRVVPDGVLCLYSAWFYYDLTLQIPQSYTVAVNRSRKYSLPHYPPITLYFWGKEYHEIGITHREINGYNVPIYNLEKCVCDAVKYRTKVGIDVCKEIVNSYIKRKDRNLMRLMEYARKMRVESTLKKYMEVIL